MSLVPISNTCAAFTNQHPFSSIVPDCVGEIFKYYIQTIENHQQMENMTPEEEFYSSRVLCWKFSPQCDSAVVARFLQRVNACSNKEPRIFYLDFSKNDSSSIDEIFPHLRGISHLNIEYCELNNSQEAFANIRGIKTLNMCGVEGVEDGAFSNLRGITSLNMSECPQETISDEAFKNLRGIKRLDMSHCSQQTITSEAFKNLRGVEKLNMNGCKQATITDEAFVNLRGILELRMMNCTQFGDEAFKNLRGVEFLDMSGCRQQKITENAFSNLREVKKLKMYACDQESFSGEILDNFEKVKLQNLDLRACNDGLLQTWMNRLLSCCRDSRNEEGVEAAHPQPFNLLHSLNSSMRRMTNRNL